MIRSDSSVDAWLGLGLGLGLGFGFGFGFGLGLTLSHSFCESPEPIRKTQWADMPG